MTDVKKKWNPPAWPWELEIITLIFFILSLFIPYYFHHHGVDPASVVTPAGNNALEVGRNSLSTQLGFLWALGIVALYVFHLAFASMDVTKITASPVHLISPCAFSLIAYYQTSKTVGIENTALNFVDGSLSQAALLVIVVALITALLTRLRTYRYMLNFNDVHWDIVTPAVYDSSYFNLLWQLRPLLYAPRRYLACNEGFVIEGWFYAMPVEFTTVHSISRLANSGIMNNGIYYASSSHYLVRIEMHESNKATYISPLDRDDFVRYCAQHIARRVPTHKASHTRHGTRHVGDTANSSTHGGQPGASQAGNKKTE